MFEFRLRGRLKMFFSGGPKIDYDTSVIDDYALIGFNYLAG